MPSIALLQAPRISGFNRSPVLTCITFALVTLFASVRLLWLEYECLHSDEVFSVRVALLSWQGMYQAAAADISHPPLFFALLKCWIAIGSESLLWMRALPAILSILALIPLCGLCEVLGLKPRERNLAIGLGIANGFLIGYTVYVRNFALLQLASLLSLWAFAFWMKATERRSRAFALLLAANTLLVYSHYWGYIVLACEGAYLLAFARRLVPAFFLSCCILALLNAPWIWSVVQAVMTKGTAVSQIHWIPRPQPIDFLWFYSTLDGNAPFAHGMVIGSLLFGLPVLYGLRSLRRNDAFCFTAWFAFLPVLITFAASLMLKQSVWATALAGDRRGSLLDAHRFFSWAIATTARKTVAGCAACLVVVHRCFGPVAQAESRLGTTHAVNGPM